MVSCDGFQDSTQQGPGFERAMIGNRDMMCATNGGRETNVGTVLTGTLLSECPEGADEVGTVDVPGNSQTTRASSRTKCR